MESSIKDRANGPSLRPIDDGFYQRGYRDAISDVLYIVALAVLSFTLARLVMRAEREGA